jgi:hypothetical protein
MLYVVSKTGRFPFGRFTGSDAASAGLSPDQLFWQQPSFAPHPHSAPLSNRLHAFVANLFEQRPPLCSHFVGVDVAGAAEAGAFGALAAVGSTAAFEGSLVHATARAAARRETTTNLVIGFLWSAASKIIMLGSYVPLDATICRRPHLRVDSRDFATRAKSPVGVEAVATQELVEKSG